MFEVYFPILVLFFLAGVTGVMMLVMPRMLGRKAPTVPKLMPYECGLDPVGDARERFPIKFYMIALVFIIFDLEVVFLYPWAVIFKKLGMFGLIEMAVFVLILLVGYIYIIRKGAMRWD